MEKTKQAILEGFDKEFMGRAVPLTVIWRKKAVRDFLSKALDRMYHEGIHEGGKKALGNQGDMILEIRNIARQETLEEVKNLALNGKGSLPFFEKIKIKSIIAQLKTGGKA